MRIAIAMILAAAALTFAATSTAQETRLSVSAGATHSDNVGRGGAGGEAEDTILDAGLQFGLVREGRLEADVAADLRYQTYVDDTFDDELVGGLTGSLRYAFIPGRLFWTIEDDFGQSFIEARDVETPGNRQDLNVFSTGPTVVVPLGARTDLTVSGRWSDVNYEESELDSVRLSALVGISRALSDTSALSLNLTSQRVEFDESPPNSDYDLHSAYLRYRSQGARSTLELSGGVTSLYDFGDSSDGPLFDLALTREIGARSTVELNLGTRFYDAADSFVRDRQVGDIAVGNEDVVPGRDPFQQDYATVTLTLGGTRTTIVLSANWRDEDREVDVTFNRETVGFGLQVTRRVGPRTTVVLDGRHATDDFTVSGVDFDEWSAGVGLDWSLTGALALGLRAEHFDGSGDTSAGVGLRNYEENRYGLRLTYSPGN